MSNFPTNLPSPQSELALETMKDPYVFDFIELKEDAQEKDLEEAFINLKNAVKDGDDYEKQRAIKKISKLTSEVLIW